MVKEIKVYRCEYCLTLYEEATNAYWCEKNDKSGGFESIIYLKEGVYC